ncbi:MAG: hypothetical protein N2044_04855 [Cyclobacteriaceae bacterium]|nr:hypothetical protein [Cyclobacteriaceae bacterium]MCX7637160.1 hypothetical protein [Cyclobacteriaceae bacterium]MDW8330353.1 hypothetical protein [Cyclobacteriaceae bacterium]
MFRIFPFIFIHWFVFSQERPVLAPEDLLRLIPEQVENFRLSGDPKARMIKIGTLSYTMAERNFMRGKQKIKILLFDYNNALIMYSQAMRSIKQPTEETSMYHLASLTESGNYQYGENIEPEKNICQLFLGVNDRFFLSISCENTDSSILHGLLNQFDFKNWVRTPIDEAKFR